MMGPGTLQHKGTILANSLEFHREYGVEQFRGCVHARTSSEPEFRNRRREDNLLPRIRTPGSAQPLIQEFDHGGHFQPVFI